MAAQSSVQHLSSRRNDVSPASRQGEYLRLQEVPAVINMPHCRLTADRIVEDQFIFGADDTSPRRGEGGLLRDGEPFKVVGINVADRSSTGVRVVEEEVAVMPHELVIPSR